MYWIGLAPIDSFVGSCVDGRNAQTCTILRRGRGCSGAACIHFPKQRRGAWSTSPRRYVGGAGFVYFEASVSNAGPSGERHWEPPAAALTGTLCHPCMQALEEKGDSLKGKRCLITGSGKVRVWGSPRWPLCSPDLSATMVRWPSTAPRSFWNSAPSLSPSATRAVRAVNGHSWHQVQGLCSRCPCHAGHIFEPDGIDASKLKTIMKIKSERGARSPWCTSCRVRVSCGS